MAGNRDCLRYPCVSRSGIGGTNLLRPGRRHQCVPGSAWPKMGLTQTSPSRTSVGQLGTSSAQAATREIEAGVVPVTGQGAVLDAAAIQGKAHMRAAIVEREDMTFVVDDEYRSMRPVHDQPPLRLQLLEAARAHEIRHRYVHQQFLPAKPLLRRWGILPPDARRSCSARHQVPT